MKIAYFDCFSGASGDMILGALLDAGLDFEYLCSELSKLQVSHYHLRSKSVTRKGLGATQIVVEVEEKFHGHHHRHLADIQGIINSSNLSDDIKQKSLLVFRKLAEVEAKVHRIPIENVHFHEVGAVDTIIDIVGAIIGFDTMGIEQIYCSPMHLGSGTVVCAHGTLPVPAPATAELVKGYPVYSTGVEGELVTPTGAAILTTLAKGFGPIPRMKVEQIGYGAGTAERSIPNLLRVMIGNTSNDSAFYDLEQVAVIETSIDDMNPQLYDFLLEKLQALGVMDVFFSPLQMKKNRPGTLVTVICSQDLVNRVSDIIMRETTTIGVRWRLDYRVKTQRKIEEITTPYGKIRLKISFAGKDVINISPEYDDCKKRALEHGVSLHAVMMTVQHYISKCFQRERNLTQPFSNQLHKHKGGNSHENLED